LALAHTLGLSVLHIIELQGFCRKTCTRNDTLPGVTGAIESLNTDNHRFWLPDD
jgi:hypothetical protein